MRSATGSPTWTRSWAATTSPPTSSTPPAATPSSAPAANTRTTTPGSRSTSAPSPSARGCMSRWRGGQPEWSEAHPRAVRPAVPRHPRRHLLRQQRRALRPRPALRAVLGHALGRPDRADHGHRLPPGPPMNAALAVIVAVAALAIGLALRARRGHDMDLEQWSVGGRGFGAIFVFLLMAGEIYSTFTFLGGAGFAYGSGGAAYYILGYGTLAYVLSYYLLPAVWRYATPRRLHSQADVFTSAFASRGLGVLVSVVAVAAMVPYLALQLKGLGIIVSQTSYGSISRRGRSGSAPSRSRSTWPRPASGGRRGRRPSRTS